MQGDRTGDPLPGNRDPPGRQVGVELLSGDTDGQEAIEPGHHTMTHATVIRVGINRVSHPCSLASATDNNRCLSAAHQCDPFGPSGDSRLVSLDAGHPLQREHGGRLSECDDAEVGEARQFDINSCGAQSADHLLCQCAGGCDIGGDRVHEGLKIRKSSHSAKLADGLNLELSPVKVPLEIQEVRLDST